MATDLLQSIADFLETGVDECTSHLMDRTTSQDEDDFLADNWPERRQAINKTCREFRTLFHEARERASKALGFAKKLKMDLEIAADFNLSADLDTLMEALQATKHVQLLAPSSSGSGYQMFIPSSIIDKENLILNLLNASCGQEGLRITNEADNDGYLLLVKSEAENGTHWNGQRINVEPNAETAIALSHIQVEGLLLVVNKSNQLSTQRKIFQNLLGDIVDLVNEQKSCHQGIAESLAELKTQALELREKISSAIQVVDDRLNVDSYGDVNHSEKSSIMKVYRETLHSCFVLGFEYHREVLRLVSGESRTKLAWGLYSFANQWMNYVLDKCEVGKGMRPRWAQPGFDFLTVACDPKISAVLTDEEFHKMKENINKCICHVIGQINSADRSPSPSINLRTPDFKQKKLYRPFSEQGTSSRVHRSTSVSSISSTQSEPARYGALHHSISDSISVSSGSQNLDSDAESGIFTCPIDEREPFVAQEYDQHKMSAIEELENKRQQHLIEHRMIGKVTTHQAEPDFRINLKRATFKWQRGKKIGEGRFGKVYTAVNIETSDLMAMKEIRVQSNDYQAIKNIADELKIFEGIRHDNLVRYYGVEVHREEIMIFMEYCDCGTIEEAAADGLSEILIRKYTKEILIALNVLHENKIVHRDLKGKNIFLTSTGTLKLGDFGCSAKLCNHTTMPGELNNLVGTTAYMAPELYTGNKEQGHGRASDIWSLGCVVIEMVTGKRPWHDLENEYQIMFIVGNGKTPPVPDHLSSEGKDFLSKCLQHDPKDRPSAEELLSHPFILFSETEDKYNIS